MESSLHTSNIPDHSPDDNQINDSQPAKTYTVAALARILGISKQALQQRVEADNLPFNIQIVHDPFGRIRLSYTPVL